MLKSAIDSLYEMMQKTTGYYADARYGSNNEEGGLTDIRVVNLNDASDKQALCRALYSKVLYTEMGIQSLIPSLGKNTLIDIDTVLQSLDVSNLTVYDPYADETTNANTYLRRNGISDGVNPWVSLLSNNNASKNGDLLNATSNIYNGKTRVAVKISSNTKRFSKAVKSLLSLNSIFVLSSCFVIRQSR